MVCLYYDPEGDNVFTRSTPSSSSPRVTTNATEKGQENNRMIESLQSKVKELQLSLAKYEPDILSYSTPLEKRPSKVTFSELQQKQHYSVSSTNADTTVTAVEKGNEISS